MSLKVSRILHAGYVFEHNGVQIAFDPIFENPFSKNCFAFPDVAFDLQKIRELKFAAVFISHFHDDHCSLESLNLLNRSTSIYIFCLHQELLEMIRDLGFKNVFSLKLNETLSIGAFEVTPHKALDEDVDSLFHIRVNNLNVLNVVDSWICEDTLEKLCEVGPWHMILWPFQTMREIEVLSPGRAIPRSAVPGTLPEEWVFQLKKLNPKFLVPSSCQFRHEEWSWYNQALFSVSYKQFEIDIKNFLPDCTVLRMNPSVSVEIDHTSAVSSNPLGWVIPRENQDVDYLFDPKASAPSTLEISKHFEDLPPELKTQVYDYCRVGLIGRYQELGAPMDSYFQAQRNWRLSVYDGFGQVNHFYYSIISDSIELLGENSEGEMLTLHWKTEIIATKLYGALHQGEALTSLYIRINEGLFSSETEKSLGGVDLISDPLIHCLFSGGNFAFQRSQLKNIKAVAGIDPTII